MFHAKSPFSNPFVSMKLKINRHTLGITAYFLARPKGFATRLPSLHAHGLRNRSPKGCDLPDGKPSFSNPFVSDKTKNKPSYLGYNGLFFGTSSDIVKSRE